MGDLCETHGVKGYPTIKTFSAGESEGEDYDGGRDFDALKAHAESLGPSCHIDSKEFCSADDLAELEKYAAMSKARRDAKIVKLQNAIDKLSAEHASLEASLQKSYEASQSSIDKLKEKLSPEIRLLTKATPKKERRSGFVFTGGGSLCPQSANLRVQRAFVAWRIRANGRDEVRAWKHPLGCMFGLR